MDFMPIMNKVKISWTGPACPGVNLKLVDPLLSLLAKPGLCAPLELTALTMPVTRGPIFGKDY
jgi:hypothetical protein